MPAPVPELPLTASLALDKDWERLAALGPEGHDALVSALRRIAALAPAARRHALSEPDPHATFPLVLTLVGLDDPDVPALFVELLDACPDDTDPLHGYLLEGLARTRTRVGTETLLTHGLRRAGSPFGNPAADLLAGHPCAFTVPLLLDHLDDDAAENRALVVDILGKVADDRSVEPLVAALDDADPAVRDAVALALGNLGDERAVLPLLLAEERDRRTRRWGHPSAAFDGRVSARLRALDTLATGTEPGTGKDPIALEEAILERTKPIRDRYAAAVEAASAGFGHPTPASLPAEALVAALARPGVEPREPYTLVYRTDWREALEVDLRRCAALHCPVSGPATSSTLDDPQGGQTWDETWTAQCSDGPVALKITRRYTPMY